MRRTTLTFTLAICLPALAVTACGSSSARPSAQAPSTVDRPTGSATSTTLPSSPGTRGTTTTRPTDRTTTTATSTTVTTATTGASASTTGPTVPATITAAYVDSVFAVLNHIYGNALRLDLATVDVPPQSIADLRSIYNDPLFNQEVTIASQALTGDLSNVRMPPGDQVTRVTHLISASPSCIFVEVATNVSEVVFKAPQPSYEFDELQPKQAGADPGGLNTTPWAISFNAAFAHPTAEPDPCTPS